MADSLKITLPLPPDELSPNARSRSHWPRTRARKRYRREAATAAMLACRDVPGLPWQQAKVRATFYFPVTRDRDGDNYNAMLKPAIDALQPNRSTAKASKPGAGIIKNDSGVTLLPPVFEIDKGEPRVELTIEPHTDGETSNGDS